jgi:hypothetical protein
LTLCQILVFLVNLINISIFLLVLTLALKDFSQIKLKIFALSAIPAVCNYFLYKKLKFKNTKKKKNFFFDKIIIFFIIYKAFVMDRHIWIAINAHKKNICLKIKNV